MINRVKNEIEQSIIKKKRMQWLETLFYLKNHINWSPIFNLIFEVINVLNKLLQINHFEYQSGFLYKWSEHDHLGGKRIPLLQNKQSVLDMPTDLLLTCQ